MIRSPLIIFDGNCQGQHLAAILSASNLAEAYFLGGDLGFLPSHLGHPCRYITEEEAHDRIDLARSQNRPVYQATQSTPMSDATVLSYSGKVSAVVRYPHLQCYALSSGESQSRFNASVSAKRMYRVDLDIIKKCQERAGLQIDIAEYIRTNGSLRPLFHTALHPAGEVVALVLKSLAAQIPEFDQSAIEDASCYLKVSEGINAFTIHPVPKLLQEELDFEWGNDYETYREIMTLCDDSRWEELLGLAPKGLQKYFNDTQYWRAMTLANLAAGTKSDAIFSFSNLISLTPGYLHFWLAGFNIYAKYSDESGLKQLHHQARAFFSGQRIYSQIMAFFYVNLGQYDQAEPYAWDYYNRTPDRADGLVPILKSLVGLGRVEEARTILTFNKEHAQGTRLAEIEANIQGIPELV